MRPLNELEQAVLTVDIPSLGLQAGDIGTVVLVHNEGKGYEVEFITMAGQTIEVLSLDADQVRAGDILDIPHARRMDNPDTTRWASNWHRYLP